MNIEKEQKRIRENMKSLDSEGELYQRYVKNLTTQEDTLATLVQQKEELRLRSVQLENDIEAIAPK